MDTAAMPEKVEQPWQLQHPPEKWQEILQLALSALRTSGIDPALKADALEAVEAANEALSVYDEAEATPPLERIASGAREGWSGLGRVVSEGLEAITHPIRTVKNLPEAIIGLPGAIASDFSSNDAEQIAHGTGVVGSLLAPSAKASAAVGRGAGATAPSVGAVIGRVVTEPFKAIGRGFDRMRLKNELLVEQIAAAKRAGLESPADQLLPQRLKQSELRTQIMEQQAARGGAQTEAALRRVELMDEQLQRAPATAENLALRNELLQLRIQLMRQMADEGGGGVPPAPSDALPSTPTPTPMPEPIPVTSAVPPTRTTTPPKAPPAKPTKGKKGSQKSVTFGKESTLQAPQKALVKELLGEMAKQSGGAGVAELEAVNLARSLKGQPPLTMEQFLAGEF